MFVFAAQAFDLADRLQTPVFILSDLDIGMNEWLCEPIFWDDSRRMNRGKVLTEADPEGREFGRYLDVDEDGIPYRTYPGTHRSRGSFFTRGTSRDPRGATPKRAAPMSTTCSDSYASSRP